MKHCSIIMFVLFNSIYCYAQFKFRATSISAKDIDFVADTANDSTRKFVLENERLLDSTYDLSKDYDFEFRLSQSGLGNNARSVFIMILRKDIWSARYFHFNKYWIGNRKDLVEVKVDSSKLNQLWYLLNRQNVLTLPSENEIIKCKTKEYLIDTFDFSNYGSVERNMIVADGIGYKFELSTPKKRRSYYYSNPEINFKEYPYIKEYSDAVLILYLIRKYLGLPITLPFG